MEFLKKEFDKKGSIFRFSIKDQTTKKVTDFYKNKPFPNYKSDDNKATILSRGNHNLLAHCFKKFIVRSVVRGLKVVVRRDSSCTNRSERLCCEGILL